jgi:hypothetical protein
MDSKYLMAILLSFFVIFSLNSNSRRTFFIRKDETIESAVLLVSHYHHPVDESLSFQDLFTMSTVTFQEFVPQGSTIQFVMMGTEPIISRDNVRVEPEGPAWRVYYTPIHHDKINRTLVIKKDQKGIICFDEQ